MTEVMVNEPDDVYVERDGPIVRDEPSRHGGGRVAAPIRPVPEPFPARLG